MRSSIGMMPCRPTPGRSGPSTRVHGRCPWLTLGLLFAAVGLSLDANADRNGGPTDEPEAYVIAPQPSSAIPQGNSAYLAGTASPNGTWLKLPGLSISQPVQILLMADNATDTLQLNLRKFHWSTPLQQATTDVDGRCSEEFRTQGDAFVTVVSPNGERPFKLFVLVGDKIEPSMSPIIVPKAATTR